MGKTFVSDKDRETEAEVGETESRFKSKLMEETWDARDHGNRDQASGKGAEAGRAVSEVETGGTSPAGWGASWARPAPQPRGGAGQLPSYQITAGFRSF